MPEKLYQVRAWPGAQNGVFRRSGRKFGQAPTTLTEAEMTDAIRNEKMLIVTVVEVEEGPKTLDQMTVKELEEFAAENQITIPAEAKVKADIFGAIKAEVEKREAEAAKAAQAQADQTQATGD